MDIKEIKELIKVLDESSLAKLEFVQGDYAITLEKEKNEPVAMMAPVASLAEPVISTPVGEAVSLVNTQGLAVSEPEIETTSTTLVYAPLVGIFYQAASPEAEPFVKVGQVINEGDTICIVEAMKVLNEIKAPVSGVVKQIHVSNGEVVEFDQVLMEIGD